VKAALSAMVVRTDRKDARGIAQLIRMGWFRAVHAKSASSQEIRALLTARRLLLDKLRDVELSVRGILRGFGLKLGKVTQRGFETRVHELVANHPMLQQITRSMFPAQGTSQDRTPRQGLSAIYGCAQCRSDCGYHLQDGG
jgi:transposase